MLLSYLSSSDQMDLSWSELFIPHLQSNIGSSGHPYCTLWIKDIMRPSKICRFVRKFLKVHLLTRSFIFSLGRITIPHISCLCYVGHLLGGSNIYFGLPWHSNIYFLLVQHGLDEASWFNRFPTLHPLSFLRNRRMPSILFWKLPCLFVWVWW